MAYINAPPSQTLPNENRTASNADTIAVFQESSQVIPEDVLSSASLVNQKKTQHILSCHLSRRQQFLYDEFIANSTTQSTLAAGSIIGIANVLMQLLKVINHPDLFTGSRPIESPFHMEPLVFHLPSIVDCALYISSKVLYHNMLQLTYSARLLRFVSVYAVCKLQPSLNPSLEERMETVLATMWRFLCAVSPVRVAAQYYWTFSKQRTSYMVKFADQLQVLTQPFHSFVQSSTLAFPDKWLLQCDSGKLQILAELLRTLKKDKHKVLIFAQMTRMLDILESFVNLHHFTYLRLDGSTNVKQRQMLVERFNRDDKLFLFLLSTRSGGFMAIGADTVIFYDTDWNPAWDAQAQSRCSCNGKTRELHIYRLVTQYTIEESVWEKAKQLSNLSHGAIKEESFAADFCKSIYTNILLKPEVSTPILLR